MKVALIYRKPGSGGHSIEEIFKTLAGELRRTVEVVEFDVGRRRNVIQDALRLRRLRADIYHITGDINYFTFMLPRARTVLTVHDIGHYLSGLRGVKRLAYKWLWLLIPFRAARQITVDSEETRKNVVEHLGIPRNRLELIAPCHGSQFKFVRRPFNDAAPTILQVGTAPHKNVPRLAEALKGLPCRLVIIGRLNKELAAKLQDCGIDFVNKSNLTHEQIYIEYVNCDLVSFVSLGEGFGVPILEAQATGRPLITSNLSPLSDVAGDGAHLVDPLDVQMIKEGLEKIIRDGTYRESLISRGLTNAARYSPAVTAHRFLELYRRTTS